jgi:battenin
MEKLMKNIWSTHYSKCVLISYWFLGLCNNFAYVVMLSAAHDILEKKNSTDQNGTKYQFLVDTNKTNKYDCNDISTGAILLADILPGIMIKLVAPFFVHKIKYSHRVFFVVIVNICSYLLVSLSPSENKILIFIGVCCASVSSSFGEITFLSLSTLYDRSLSLTGKAHLFKKFLLLFQLRILI